MVTNYEIRKMSNKKIEKISFNLLEEHPSHIYIVIAKRNNIFIPCTNSIKLLPNIVDLNINSITTDGHILKRREEYAIIILLLF